MNGKSKCKNFNITLYCAVEMVLLGEMVVRVKAHKHSHAESASEKVWR